MLSFPTAFVLNFHDIKIITFRHSWKIQHEWLCHEFPNNIINLLFQVGWNNAPTTCKLTSSTLIQKIVGLRPKAKTEKSQKNLIDGYSRRR